MGQGAEGLWGQLSGLGWVLCQGAAVPADPVRSLGEPGGRIGGRLGAALAAGVKAQDANTVWQGRGAGEGACGWQAAATERTFPLGTERDPLLEGSRGHDRNE